MNDDRMSADERDAEARARRDKRDGDARLRRLQRDGKISRLPEASAEAAPQPEAKTIEHLTKRIAELEKQLWQVIRSMPPTRRRNKLFFARKGATNLQFTELSVPETGTTLAPFVSGGRTATADSDPIAPIDLGQDDWVLVAVPSGARMRSVRIAGGAIRDIRYNTTSHNLQVTYKASPAEADWLNRVQFESCSASRLSDGQDGTSPTDPNAPMALQSSGVLDSSRVSAVQISAIDYGPPRLAADFPWYIDDQTR